LATSRDALNKLYQKREKIICGDLLLDKRQIFGGVNFALLVIAKIWNLIAFNIS
jgi:hypothetical protein